MKIGVCIKQVPDTGSPIRLNGDFMDIETAGLKYVINPYDEFALEEALVHKDENPATEVVVFTVGQQEWTQTIYSALAMGADRAVHVCLDDRQPFLDNFTTAHALRKVIVHEAPDMVFMGKQSTDNGSHTLVTVLAALIGWPHASGVVALKVAGDEAIATREADGGLLEEMRMKKPFIVGVTRGINQPRYPSLKGTLGARAKEIKTIFLKELDLGERITPNFKLEHLSYPRSKNECRIIEGDARDAAFELIRLLRNEAKVI